MKLIETEGQLNLSFYCPGCECYHGICSEKYHPYPGPVWEWNGSMDKPTFIPSLLVRHYSNKLKRKILCHSFIKEGKIQFLGDCTHELAGQTVEMDEI